MRTVCRLAREVLDIAARAVKPGVTTDYIDEIVHNACVEREVQFFHTLHGLLLTLEVVSFTTELQSLPKISLHIPK